MRKSSNILLATVTLLSAISIVIGVTMTPDGFITSDSVGYLGVASNIRTGNGMNIPDFFVPEGSRRFTSQPTGYSFMIAFIATIIPGISMFWASKIFNILCLAVLALLFRTISRNNAWLYMTMMFFMSFLHIFSYTWSEVPFLVLLLGFIIALNKHRHSEQGSIVLTAIITTLGLSLFLTRYAGLFLMGTVGILALNDLINKRFNRATQLIIAGLTVATGAAAYLASNYKAFGSFAGDRISAQERPIALLWNLIYAHAVELNPFIKTVDSKASLLFFLLTTLYTITAACWFLFRNNDAIQHIKSKVSDNYRTLRGIMLITAAIYWLAIVAVRFRTDLDDFNYRLLAPSTFLLLCVFLNACENKLPDKTFTSFKRVWIFIVIQCLLASLPMYIAIKKMRNEPNYVQSTAMLHEKYQDIPRKSIIGFGSKHLVYLMPHIQPTSPTEVEGDNKYESMQSFISRLEESFADHIFIEIMDTEKLEDDHDQSVFEFMKQHQGEVFYQIR